MITEPTHQTGPLPRAWVADLETIAAKEAMTVARECVKLLDAKQQDYGPLNITMEGMPGLKTRLVDKVCRLKNLIEHKRIPTNESLEDTFKDIANYGIIGILLLRDKWPNKEIDIQQPKQSPPIPVSYYARIDKVIGLFDPQTTSITVTDLCRRRIVAGADEARSLLSLMVKEGRLEEEKRVPASGKGGHTQTLYQLKKVKHII